MNAEDLARIQRTLTVGWSELSGKGCDVRGISVRVATDDRVFEVVLDKYLDLTCKRIS